MSDIRSLWLRLVQGDLDDISLLGRDPLLEATRLRISGAVRVLSQRFGLDVNRPDCYGRTALWWAAQRRHKNLARRLLQAGADPDIGDSGYRSARALLSRFLPEWGATATL